jgi:hypothetical protein
MTDPSKLNVPPFNSFFTTQRRMTHSTVVVVSGAILDKALEDAVTKRIGPFVEGTQERLFNGPLSSSRGRSLMAYALKIIDKPTFDVLESFEQCEICLHIRNLFSGLMRSGWKNACGISAGLAATNSAGGCRNW